MNSEFLLEQHVARQFTRPATDYANAANVKRHVIRMVMKWYWIKIITFSSLY